jgi:hypothetical protein
VFCSHFLNELVFPNDPVNDHSKIIALKQIRSAPDVVTCDGAKRDLRNRYLIFPDSVSIIAVLNSAGPFSSGLWADLSIRIILFLGASPLFRVRVLQVSGDLSYTEVCLSGSTFGNFPRDKLFFHLIKRPK